MNQNKNKLSKLIKVVLRHAPILLIPFSLLIFFTTLDLGFPFIIWFAALGADNTFMRIDCAKKNTKLKVSTRQIRRVYLDIYLGMIIVIIGFFLALPSAIWTLTYNDAFFISMLGALIIVVRNIGYRADKQNGLSN